MKNITQILCMIEILLPIFEALSPLYVPNYFFHIFMLVMLLQVQNSSLKKDAFADAVKDIYNQELQLIRDVLTCWSSTLLMIQHVLDLQEVGVNSFIHLFNANVMQAINEITRPERADLNLNKHEMSEEEWSILEDFEEILSVCSSIWSLAKC